MQGKTNLRISIFSDKIQIKAFFKLWVIVDDLLVLGAGHAQFKIKKVLTLNEYER